MKVLLATEGSEFSQAALKKCCKMFEESVNTEIRIISAVKPAFTPPEPFAVPVEYLREADAVNMHLANDVVAQAELEIRNGFPDLAVNLTTSIVKGPPARVIVEEAEKWGADLIILGSHGYGPWQRALLGSVSNAVVHHARCSVFVVRPPEKLNGNHS